MWLFDTDDAKLKLCPFTFMSDPSKAPFEYNNCKAGKCMAWEWDRELKREPPIGHCALIFGRE